MAKIWPHIQKWPYFDPYTKNAKIWSKMHKILSKMPKIWPPYTTKFYNFTSLYRTWAKFDPPYTKICQILPPYQKMFNPYTKRFDPLYDKMSLNRPSYTIKLHFRDILYRKWNFRTPSIQQNGIFETPLYKNGIFETPYTTKWHFKKSYAKKKDIFGTP